ncbi:hypothetical protein PEL8287_03393 [Roseovarius litorisediminis]|uniref:DUF3168 domain-containing protein n=1 Tax=Roseovarius litorisediminis TaxID=1312363 RepID=A0A1Y5TEJ4_9RHOB|nr:DUF3168 domain-containing protein [Roseovarius litorisediminis]SLN62264.1 hypothetical protein PEL8287_03393 [Roseovarius litorisediminis]
MVEPSIALKTAVRAALIVAPDVIALVDIDNIRAGSTRPDKLPSVIMAHAQTQHLGRASGGQYLTRVFLDLHIWAIEDGAEAAQAIGHAVSVALWDAPAPVDCSVDDYQRPSFQWMRDPQPELAYTHGVATVEAAIRWSV